MKTFVKPGYIAGLAAILLTSCASIPITSMPKLMRLDPETVNFADLELAVRIDDNVEILHDTLKLNVKIKNTNTGEVFDEDMYFSNSARLSGYLARQQKPSSYIVRYKLSNEAAIKAEKLRQRILQAKKKNPGKNIMNISVGSKFCKKPGAKIDKIRFTSYLKTAPDRKFFKLFKEYSIEVKGGKMPVCEG